MGISVEDSEGTSGKGDSICGLFTGNEASLCDLRRRII